MKHLRIHSNLLLVFWLSIFCASLADAQVIEYCYNCTPTPSGCWECTIGIAAGGYSCPQVNCDGCSVSGVCGTGSGCFSSDVTIHTPDGLQAITSLEVGDLIISYSADGENVVSSVSRTYISESWQQVVINGSLRVTSTHPFLIGEQWVEAGDLRVGDIMQTADRGMVPIYDIATEDCGIRVYNIEVADSHTFYAGGFLVHNKHDQPQE